jgi:hypothetical protein
VRNATQLQCGGRRDGAHFDDLAVAELDPFVRGPDADFGHLVILVDVEEPAR